MMKSKKWTVSFNSLSISILHGMYEVGVPLLCPFLSILIFGEGSCTVLTTNMGGTQTESVFLNVVQSNLLLHMTLDFNL